MEQFRPAKESPRLQLRTVGRTLADLPESTTDVRSSRRALAYTGLALVALLAFLGWLLVG